MIAEIASAKPEAAGDLPPIGATFFARSVKPKHGLPHGVGRLVVARLLDEDERTHRHDRNNEGCHARNRTMRSGLHSAAEPVNTVLLKRLGVLGFLFFLLKGLAWLLVPLALYSWSR